LIGEVLGDGEFLEGAIESAAGDVTRVIFVPIWVWQFAHARGFPDEVDMIFGEGVIDFVIIGEFPGGSFAPAFGEEIVEEARVAADDPELTAGAFGVAMDVRDIEDFDLFEVRRHFGGDESVALVIEVGMASDIADFFFEVGGTEEEFVVDEGVTALLDEGEEGVSLLDGQADIGGLADLVEIVCGHDDMGGFHVGDDVTFGLEIVDGEVGDGGEALVEGLIVEPGEFESFDDVLAVDPGVDEFVLSEDVEVDAGVAGADAIDFGLGPTALPRLHFFGGDIDGERFLGVDGAIWIVTFGIAEFHDEGEFLPWAVELRVDELFEGVGIERDVLADAAVFNDEIEAASGDGLGEDAVDGACAFEANAVGGEPLRFVPIVDVEQVGVGKAEAGEVEVPAVAGFGMDVDGAEDGDEGFGVDGSSSEEGRVGAGEEAGDITRFVAWREWLGGPVEHGKRIVGERGVGQAVTKEERPSVILGEKSRTAC
jgi:hypothetical protein